ncbi:MAG: hypothetical protein ACTSX7_00185, partial [Alphaproteobacteria bacterium]
AVDLLRGSAVGASNTQIATVSNEGGIQVFRGAGSKPKTRPIPKPQTISVVGGDNLWFIDRAKRKITGCEIRTGTQVGSSQIRCTTRRLSVLR